VAWHGSIRTGRTEHLRGAASLIAFHTRPHTHNRILPISLSRAPSALSRRTVEIQGREQRIGQQRLAQLRRPRSPDRVACRRGYDKVKGAGRHRRHLRLTLTEIAVKLTLTEIAVSLGIPNVTLGSDATAATAALIIHTTPLIKNISIPPPSPLLSLRQLSYRRTPKTQERETCFSQKRLAQLRRPIIPDRVACHRGDEEVKGVGCAVSRSQRTRLHGRLGCVSSQCASLSAAP
jgi:hypothetical protein